MNVLKIANGIFNNREIAIIIWTSPCFIVLLNQKIRHSFIKILNLFFKFYVLAIFTTMALYIALVVCLLNILGLWKTTDIKDTLVWFFLSAIIVVFKAFMEGSKPNVLKSIMLNNIKLIVFMEFIIGSITYELWIEIILVPFATLIVFLQILPS